MQFTWRIETEGFNKKMLMDGMVPSSITLASLPSLAFLPASVVPQVSFIPPCPSVPAADRLHIRIELIDSRNGVQPTRDLDKACTAQQRGKPGDAPELRRPLPERLRGLAGDRHWRRQQLRRLGRHVRHGQRQRRRPLRRHVHRLAEPRLDAGDGHRPANNAPAAAAAVHRHRRHCARVCRGAQEVLAVVGQELMVVVVREAAAGRRVHVDPQANAAAAAVAVVVEVGAAREGLEVVDLVVGVTAAVVETAAAALVAASDAHEVLKLGAFGFCGVPPICTGTVQRRETEMMRPFWESGTEKECNGPTSAVWHSVSWP